MAFGLLPEGYAIKDLQTITTELEAEFQNIFGTDIDVSATSNFGQLIGILAKRESNIWELGEAVYASQDPDRAEGTSLDRVAALIASERLQPTDTSVTAVLFGDQGTVVALGKQASKNVTGEVFSLLGAVTIDKADAVFIDMSVTTVLDTTLYQVTINASNFQFTSGGSTTAALIMAGLKAAVDLGSEPIAFTDNLDGTATITANSNLTAFDFLEGANLQNDLVGTNGQFDADLIGSTTLPANTLQNIVTPVSGWNSINNLEAGIAGRNLEVDEEFRIRLRVNQRSIGGGTDDAMKARLLEDVTNVTDAVVTSNRTSGVVDTIPGKAFEIVIIGGADQDIADKIWDVQPSGIESFGSTPKIVVDSEGNNQTVKFSRPENVYVWGNIDITLYSEETFPSDGLTAIKDAIVAFALTEYVIGKDVIRERWYTPIFTVAGIESAVITLATSAAPAGPPGSFTAADIAINGREIASIAAGRLTVGIV